MILIWNLTCQPTQLNIETLFLQYRWISTDGLRNYANIIVTVETNVSTSLQAEQLCYVSPGHRFYPDSTTS